VKTPNVSEKPILFSAPMVRAILRGQKTQTRRVVQSSPGQQREWLTRELIDSSPCLSVGQLDDGTWGARMEHPRGGPLGWVRCPYGGPGGRLWVRETWAAFTPPTYEYNECEEIDGPPSDMRSESQWVRDEDIVFRADGTSNPNRWRPAIHMPRWASRITLEVTGVRVERLQSITDDAARAEGVSLGELQPATVNGAPGKVAIYDPVKAFQVLWNQINHERVRWSSNPFVWVVSFRRVAQ
jgi:hypothetical protein